MEMPKPIEEAINNVVDKIITSSHEPPPRKELREAITGLVWAVRDDVVASLEAVSTMERTEELKGADDE